MEKVVDWLNSIIWSEALILLCVFTGLYFTVRTGFVQFAYIKEMIGLLFKPKTTSTGISPFQAFALALSGRVGTGNIVGVATAIAMGGPGAIFWMWIIAIFGSASAFIESTLGQVFKKETGGQYRGGPAYYIEKGLGLKWYAITFAVLMILGSTILLPGIQTNAITGVVKNAFGIVTREDFFIPFNSVAAFVIALLVLIIFGGVKRLAQVAGTVVPLMAGVYILLGLAIVFLNFEKIPEVFSMIISSALGQDAIFGGIVGTAITWGVKRGIYSNEAGQGTGPHASSAAAVNHPAEQGLVQAFSVYIDTLFVCSTTAFMILFTGQYNVTGSDGALLVENVKGLEFTGFTQSAVAYHFPSFGNEIIAISLFFFAFTTILAYYYMAETNMVYIINSINPKLMKIALFGLRILFLIGVYIGGVKEAQLIWAIGDVAVGLMAWLNLIAILLLGNLCLKVWKNYREQKKQGIENPIFRPKDLGIKNAEYWDRKDYSKNH